LADNRSAKPQHRQNLVFLFAALIAVGLQGCATAGGPRSGDPGARAALPPGETPANEAAELRDIQTLYVKGAHEAALLRLDAFESRYPKSAYRGYSDNLRGLVYLAKKDYAKAANLFTRALGRKGSATGFENYVLYNLASTQLELNDVEAAIGTLGRIRAEHLDPDNRLKYHQLKSQIHLRRELFYEAAKEALLAGKYFSKDQIAAAHEDNSNIGGPLARALSRTTNTLALDQLYRELEESPLSDMVLIELISKELVAGNFGKAHEYYDLLTRNHPKSMLLSRARDLVDDSRKEMPADMKVVGLLLPMTGKFARFGERTLHAIQLGFRIFNEREPNSGITLVIEDSGEEPAQAIAALNRLVHEHRAGAVLGPMTSKGLDQVMRRAEELGVPLISIARYGGAPGQHVINGGITMKNQARELARHAIDQLGIKKFAILTPQDKTGQETSQHFWDAVEEFGGEITGHESYPVGETDFRQAVDKLSGLHYTEARQRELDELAKLREENEITKRNRRTEQFFALPPIVDYEAVFIPDEPGVSGQILPTFAYRDVDKVIFLGTSAWNSAELPRRAKQEASKAIFVDAFYPDSNAPATVRFLDRYRATFNQEPGAMEATAYDAARILEQALSTGSGSRDDLLENLKSLRDFPGATGTIRYEDGTLPRTIQFLTFSGEKVVPAPGKR